MPGQFADRMADYVPVNERIEAFYKAFPDGSLQSEIVELTASRVTFKAYAYRSKDDPRPGIGHSSLDIPGATPYTKGSEVENAETSAWGRAIASLGFEVKRGVSSAEEVRNKQSQGGERDTSSGGVTNATTRPASGLRTKGDYQSAIAEAARERGMTFAAIEAKAKALGVARGEATVAQLAQLLATIRGNEQPESGAGGVEPEAAQEGSGEPPATRAEDMPADEALTAGAALAGKS